LFSATDNEILNIKKPAKPVDEPTPEINTDIKFGLIVKYSKPGIN